MCQVDLVGVDLVELIRWELILLELIPREDTGVHGGPRKVMNLINNFSYMFGHILWLTKAMQRLMTVKSVQQVFT